MEFARYRSDPTRRIYIAYKRGDKPAKRKPKLLEKYLLPAMRRKVSTLHARLCKSKMYQLRESNLKGLSFARRFSIHRKRIQWQYG